MTFARRSGLVVVDVELGEPALVEVVHEGCRRWAMLLGRRRVVEVNFKDSDVPGGREPGKAGADPDADGCTLLGGPIGEAMPQSG